MGKEIDRISSDIACLNIEHFPATLVSTTGSHCEVWQAFRTSFDNAEKTTLNFVVKRHYQPCEFREVRNLCRDYYILKEKLTDIIPNALFVQTSIDNRANLIVIAETNTPWFNLANPINETEAIPTLRQNPKALSQLKRFLQAAKQWHDEKGWVIDLYGLDNLILNKNSEVRYIDSFSVFFYEDMLKFVTDDDSLQEKIDLSLKRRSYLEYIYAQATP
ncbi:hypothetical protein [Beggiatoa leptomitoformis]|uniref:PhoP regulatory network protein YrbL n=1 Tax=Beggiatoa leptomitoformis TaxID=288004 RepID=A0A2N9YED3_9GAMM|nr:hypothetical protein [Beggiatoa leptomitoformis]ALG68875.1 hypothetical protein AL038_15690 [Beggiatoa leptomitoformis]AUI68755.1 hypothetical protein BLE401_08565 [Beggiatoa leptomitoformis]